MKNGRSCNVTLRVIERRLFELIGCTFPNKVFLMIEPLHVSSAAMWSSIELHFIYDVTDSGGNTNYLLLFYCSRFYDLSSTID